MDRIDNVDLSLFDFDYDLTFAVFFLDAKERIYSRYGGRDSKAPESRMSLAGLRYTMKLVLDNHRRGAGSFSPRRRQKPVFINQLRRFRQSNGCIHCHEAKEMMYAELKSNGQWNRDLVWRHPLPKNLGFTLEVDRGNVVKSVDKDTPAFEAGLQRGDILQRLHDVPIRSMADARFALDRAPMIGSIAVAWHRDGKALQSKIPLPNDWKQSDYTWRPSVWRLAPRLFVFGNDLSAKEKNALCLSPKRTAFRQDELVSAQAKSVGIREGDVIIGVDDRKLELSVRDFLQFVRFNYVKGDTISIDVIRNGKRLKLPLTFR